LNASVLPWYTNIGTAERIGSVYGTRAASSDWFVFFQVNLKPLRVIAQRGFGGDYNP